MKYGTVVLEKRGALALLWLNRPERLNAYVPEMGEDLIAALRALAADDTVAAVAVTGTGRAFCAGADRDCFRGEPGPSGLRLGEEAFVRDFALEIADYPKLTVAAFNGVAVGLGVTMTLCMDLRIAAAGALLKLNFAELGILPGLGSSFALPRLIGLGQAKKLLLCDRELPARRALALGLIEEVCPPAQLLARAEALAARAAGCQPAALAAIKRLLNAGAGSTLAAAVATEQQQAQALNHLLRGGGA